MRIATEGIIIMKHVMHISCNEIDPSVIIPSFYNIAI